jgi:hypothetical protein
VQEDEHRLDVAASEDKSPEGFQGRFNGIVVPNLTP